MNEEAKRNTKDFYLSSEEISAFCLQISLLLRSGISLSEGINIMSEDLSNLYSKNVFQKISSELEFGKSFYLVLKESNTFPYYVTYMAEIGERTGTLDDVMESLYSYYKKESNVLKSIKNALMYPLIMILMMFAVLFLLFTKVMPIFENVFNQLGTQISPFSRSVARFGGILSGCAVIFIILSSIVIFVVFVLYKRGTKFDCFESLKRFFFNKSKIVISAEVSKFTSVLAIILNSGVDIEEGLVMAEKLVESDLIKQKIGSCIENLQKGESFAEALSKAQFFSSFNLQMIRVGEKSGCLDKVFIEIEKNYEHQTDEKIYEFISRFEPTIIAILSVAVGVILLSVMLPLVAMMASMG